jgi:hypothetical protein
MRSQYDQIHSSSRTRSGALACLAAGLLLLLAESAAPQDSQRAPDPSPPPAPAAQPGVIESIGRFFEQGAANFRAHLGGAKERFDKLGDEAAANQKDFGEKAVAVGKGAADVTKSAVDAVVKLPTARVVNGRETCALAPNGAPDCVAAAEVLCRKQGFGSGKSIDFTSARQCPVKAWLGGREGNEAECTTVTFISRAMCQ